MCVSENVFFKQISIVVCAYVNLEVFLSMQDIVHNYICLCRRIYEEW